MILNMTLTPVRDERLATFEIIALSVIFSLIITGNIICLVMLCRYTRAKKRIFIFMLNLCIADLSVGLFNVLPQLIWKITFEWKGGFTLCKIVPYLQVFSMYLTTYILISIALDRYLAICHAMSVYQRSCYRVKVCIFLTWFVSFIFATPQLFIFKRVTVTYRNEMNNDMVNNSPPNIPTFIYNESLSNCKLPTQLKISHNYNNGTNYSKLAKIKYLNLSKFNSSLWQNCSFNQHTLDKPSELHVNSSPLRLHYYCRAIHKYEWSENIYILWFLIAIYIIPLFVILYCYISICTKILINIKNKRKPCIIEPSNFCYRGLFKSRKSKLISSHYVHSESKSSGFSNTYIETSNSETKFEDFPKISLKQTFFPLKYRSLQYLGSKIYSFKSKNLYIPTSKMQKFRNSTPNIEIPNILIDQDIESKNKKKTYTEKKNDDELCTHPKHRFRTHSLETISRAKVKTIQLTLSVVICYIICWSPYFISIIYLNIFNKKASIYQAFVIFSLLGNLTSCFNPWIYILFNKSVFRCKSKERNEEMDGIIRKISSKRKTLNSVL
ncbi:unnamed protein product [Gordionus sp. m RMFG-2023]